FRDDVQQHPIPIVAGAQVLLVLPNPDASQLELFRQLLDGGAVLAGIADERLRCVAGRYPAGRGGFGSLAEDGFISFAQVLRKHLPAERPEVDEPVAGKKSCRLLVFGMAEELRILKGEGLAAVAIYVHDLEQHPQIPVLETEAEKEKGGSGVGENAANLVGQGRDAANDRYQKLDQVSLGQNQRARIFMVAEEVIDERSVWSRGGQPCADALFEAVVSLLRWLLCFLERGEHQAVRRCADAEPEGQPGKVAMKVRRRSRLTRVEILYGELEILAVLALAIVEVGGTAETCGRKGGFAFLCVYAGKEVTRQELLERSSIWIVGSNRDARSEHKHAV